METQKYQIDYKLLKEPIERLRERNTQIIRLHLGLLNMDKEHE
jgi:hypothetical protein